MHGQTINVATYRNLHGCLPCKSDITKHQLSRCKGKGWEAAECWIVITSSEVLGWVNVQLYKSWHQKLTGVGWFSVCTKYVKVQITKSAGTKIPIHHQTSTASRFTELTTCVPDCCVYALKMSICLPVCQGDNFILVETPLLSKTPKFTGRTHKRNLECSFVQKKCSILLTIKVGQ